MKNFVLFFFVGVVVSSCGVRFDGPRKNQSFETYTLKLFGAGHDPKSVVEFKKVFEAFKGSSCHLGDNLFIEGYLEEGKVGKPPVAYDLNAYYSALNTDCKVVSDLWEWVTYQKIMQPQQLLTPAAALLNGKGEMIKRFDAPARGEDIVRFVKDTLK